VASSVGLSLIGVSEKLAKRFP